MDPNRFDPARLYDNEQQMLALAGLAKPWPPKKHDNTKNGVKLF